MHYREIRPAAALRDHVRAYWLLDAEARPEAGAIAPIERILPDGSPELIVHLGDPYSRAAAGREERQPRALLVGQLTGPLLLRPSRTTRIVAVRFEPHGLAAFLGASARELTDAQAGLDDAWGREGAALPERIERLRDDVAIARELDAFLLPRRRRVSGGDRVAACVARLRASSGMDRVDDLARFACCTPRQLERLFLRHVGIPPKRLARVFRLQHAVSLLRREDLSLVDVALLSGHADQPHLVREMRELAGVPPSALRSEPPELAGILATG